MTLPSIIPQTDNLRPVQQQHLKTLGHQFGEVDSVSKKTHLGRRVIEKKTRFDHLSFFFFFFNLVLYLVLEFRLGSPK